MYSSGADLELSERDSVAISIAPENLGCSHQKVLPVLLSYTTVYAIYYSGF